MKRTIHLTEKELKDIIKESIIETIPEEKPQPKFEEGDKVKVINDAVEKGFGPNGQTAIIAVSKWCEPEKTWMYLCIHTYLSRREWFREQDLEPLNFVRGENINEAENHGWVIETDEAEEAYELAARYWGNEDLNQQIVRAMSNKTLAEILAYVFRMNNFKEWNEYKSGSGQEPIMETFSSDSFGYENASEGCSEAIDFYDMNDVFDRFGVSIIGYRDVENKETGETGIRYELDTPNDLNNKEFEQALKNAACDSDGVFVSIGQNRYDPKMKRCSVVVLTY